MLPDCELIGLQPSTPRAPALPTLLLLLLLLLVLLVLLLYVLGRERTTHHHAIVVMRCYAPS
jgi:hypothetical protein